MKNYILLLLFVSINSIQLVIAQTERPQTPKQPFDYNSEDVVFKNTIDSVSLAGTFTFPKEGKNFPVVILISGSGPQDRNSEVFNHKPFLVISDYLTKKGIAVLRVDDRGTGKSEGVYNNTSLNGFVNDTESAIRFLKTRTEVDSNKIGLLGHSLGGLIAPIIASQSKDVSFVVLLAAPGIRGDKLMLLQKEKIERKMSFNEEYIALGQKNIGGAYDIILKSESNQKELSAELKVYFNNTFGNLLTEDQLESLSKGLAIPWLRDLIKFDPKTVLSKTKCPVLALNGSLDLQVPAKENLKTIKETLKNSGNKHVKTIKLRKLNHLFQKCETGLVYEYESLEETFSVKAMSKISSWILKESKKKRFNN